MLIPWYDNQCDFSITQTKLCDCWNSQSPLLTYRSKSELKAGFVNFAFTLVLYFSIVISVIEAFTLFFHFLPKKISFCLRLGEIPHKVYAYLSHWSRLDSTESFWGLCPLNYKLLHCCDYGSLMLCLEGLDSQYFIALLNFIQFFPNICPFLLPLGHL